MWDIPVEVKNQQELATQAYGNVLCAGYGLGLLQRLLFQNKRVDSVLSIEILEGVIRECERVYGKIHGDVIIGDFYEYNTSRKFDCVIGDNWIDQSLRDIESYKRFKIKAKTLIEDGGKVLAWGMDYMEYMLANGKMQARES